MSSIHLLLNRSATINIATILVTGIFTTITTSVLTYTLISATDILLLFLSIIYEDKFLNLI